MIARKSLIETLHTLGAHEPLIAYTVDAFLAQHARELAARIRTELETDSYAYVSGWTDAADLIDPDGERS
jgi:hypothetical protein